MKQVICIILSLIMLAGTGVTAFAADNKCGDNLTYAFGEDGKLSVNGSGDFYANAKDILTNAENDRHNKRIADINSYYEGREKTLNGKIAKIIVEGYYQGTDKEYELEIAALSNDMNNLRELIESTTDEAQKAQYQKQLKEKNNRYNELTILHSRKQEKEILEAELDAVPSEKEQSLAAEDKLHSENLSYITETIKKKENSAAPQIKINVSTVTLKKPKAIKKGFKLSWKKASGVSGYVIQYSTSKKFKKKTTKTIKIKKAETIKKTVKKLKSKKKYYIRIKAYKKQSGKVYYSKWSKTKAVKTK